MRVIQNKTKKMLSIEVKHGEQIEELLRRLYVDEGMSVKDIALFIGTTYAITHGWIKRAGIYSRRVDLGVD